MIRTKHNFRIFLTPHGSTPRGDYPENFNVSIKNEALWFLTRASGANGMNWKIRSHHDLRLQCGEKCDLQYMTNVSHQNQWKSGNLIVMEINSLRLPWCVTAGNTNFLRVRKETALITLWTICFTTRAPDWHVSFEGSLEKMECN